MRSGQRLGLVGRNGVGKSTLLDLLTGQLQPSEGRVVRSPGLRLGTLPRLAQGTLWAAGLRALAHVRTLEAALREEERYLSANQRDLERYAELSERFEVAGGYGAEVRLEQTLAAFGFSPDDYDKEVTTLSGGERSRLALALSLVDQPDVLLLDEPSSHLDLTTRRTLAERLKTYPGGLIFASHDRALLDAVCTHIAHLEAGHLTLYRGNYSSFKQRQGLALKTSQKRAKEVRKEVEALSASSARLRGWGTPTAARQRRGVEKRLERLGEVKMFLKSQAARTLTTQPQKVKGTLLEAEHLSKTYEARTLVQDASLRIEAGDKLALVGPNGTGKSTLLNMLTGDLEPDDIEASVRFGRNTRIAIFDQKTRGLEAEVSLLAQLTRYVSEPRARLLLALVGLPTIGDATPETLSEGQKARAGIALVIASEANLLILDEPTENLDIEMIERLENALQDTEAAFVLVSHDAALVERVAERVLSLEDGELKEFRGGLKGYFRGSLRLEPDLPTPELEEKPGESPEGRLERLELERLELEELRLTSYRLSEREQVRLERRYKNLLTDLFELYEARQFIPTPLYQSREGAVQIEVESVTNGYRFTSNTGLSIQLLKSGPPAHLGHLVIHQTEGQCTLAWARDAVLRLVVRVAFEHLEFRILQLQNGGDLSAAGFEAAGADWWVLSRARYEVEQGFVRN